MAKRGTRAVESSHIDAKYAERITKAAFGTPDKLPDLVLEITVNQRARAHCQRYFEGRYRPIIERPDYGYVILRRTGRGRRPHGQGNLSR